MLQSVGLASRYLIVPISQTQDTPGPMTRTMVDAAYILSVIAGAFVYNVYYISPENVNRSGPSRQLYIRYPIRNDSRLCS